jgi:uncharacterized protein (TIGR01777 family)
MLFVRRIAITGATGTIGHAVTAALKARGDSVVALTRDPERAKSTLGGDVEAVRWSNPTNMAPPPEAFSGADAVIHLLGEPLAQRWSEDVKTRIRESRVLGTRHVATALAGLPENQRPRVLVSQSATGFYGPSDDRELDENAPAGNDFLAGVVTGWEHEAQAAEPLMRVVRTRTGVVLTPSGGALAKMLPFFRVGVGGPVAGGRQYLSWIHLQDLVAALLFCVDQDAASGAVNVTSPNPVTNAEFSHALGRALHRPALLPVPAFGVRLLYGEMSEIVVTGQRAIPRRLHELGFSFQRSEVEPALRDVLQGN